MSRLPTTGLCLLLLCTTACGGKEPEAEKPTQPPPTVHKALPPDAPATQRMLGTWRMDLEKVPDSALTKEFIEFKRSGKTGVMSIEYIVNEREFILHKRGAGGRVLKRWFYEVISENGNALTLARTDEKGIRQEIPAIVEGDTLRIGEGGGVVPLTRVTE